MAKGLSNEEAEIKAPEQMRREAVSAHKPGNFAEMSTEPAKPCSSSL